MSTRADLAMILGQEPTEKQWEVYKRGEGPLFDLPCTVCGKDREDCYGLRCGATDGDYAGAYYCTLLKGHHGDHVDHRYPKSPFRRCRCRESQDGRCNAINGKEPGWGTPEALAEIMETWHRESICYDCQGAKFKAKADEERRILEEKRELASSFLSLNGVSAEEIEPENDSDRPNEGGQWFRVSIFVPDRRLQDVA